MGEAPKWGAVVLGQIRKARRRLEEANVPGPYSAVLGERDALALKRACPVRVACWDDGHQATPGPPEWAPACARWWGRVDDVDVFVA